MKEQLTSLLRHAVTALAGLGSFLAYRGIIAAEDSAAVDAAGASIGEAVVVVVVAIVTRALISFMGKLGLPKIGGSSVSMMTGGLLVLASTASLMSCADYQGPRIVFGVEAEQGRVEYDSAKGGTVRVDARVPAINRSK